MTRWPETLVLLADVQAKGCREGDTTAQEMCRSSVTVVCLKVVALPARCARMN